MSEVIRDIRRAYMGICNAKDAKAPFLDLAGILSTEQPSVEVLETLPTKRNVASQRTIDQIVKSVRNGRLQFKDHHYFLGTGIMAAGNSDGQIMAIDYELNSHSRDEVAIIHGSYQYWAVHKLGFGALTARLGLTQEADMVTRSRREDELSLELGLTPPRYLGHAVRMLSTTGSFIAAGASGMLPSLHTSKEFTKRHPRVIESALAQGIDGLDIAAGLHDTVAASNLALYLGRVSTSANPQVLSGFSPSDFSPTTFIH